jgi:hypothetical protein
MDWWRGASGGDPAPLVAVLEREMTKRAPACFFAGKPGRNS